MVKAMIRSASASTSASTGSEPHALKVSQVDRFGLSCQDLARPAAKLPKHHAPAVAPFHEEGRFPQEVSHHELSTAQARNARRTRRRAQRREDHGDEDQFNEVSRREDPRDAPYEVTSIREERCSSEDTQVECLLPHQVEVRPPIPESWEDCVEELAAPRMAVAICCESCHGSGSDFGVSKGEFVRVWLDHASANGWVYAEELDGSRCGWLPVTAIEQPQKNQVWAKVLHCPRAQRCDQLEVPCGNYLLIELGSEKDGWVHADEPLDGLSGRMRLDWLEL
mmetsp:Transcript_102094/g.243488  ORF Transcript_102094/g.243488 Transcript_102094/m.243488 type:complete len:280 (-) Transcript_102094:50-889(-)